MECLYVYLFQNEKPKNTSAIYVIFIISICLYNITVSFKLFVFGIHLIFYSINNNMKYNTYIYVNISVIPINFCFAMYVLMKKKKWMKVSKVFWMKLYFDLFFENMNSKVSTTHTKSQKRCIKKRIAVKFEKKYIFFCIVCMHVKRE